MWAIHSYRVELVVPNTIRHAWFHRDLTSEGGRIQELVGESNLSSRAWKDVRGADDVIGVNEAERVVAANIGVDKLQAWLTAMIESRRVELRVDMCEPADPEEIVVTPPARRPVGVGAIVPRLGMEDTEDTSIPVRLGCVPFGGQDSDVCLTARMDYILLTA